MRGLCEIEHITAFHTEFTGKLPLAPAIAFPERMQGIHVSIVGHKRLEKGMAIIFCIPASVVKIGEYGLCIIVYELCPAEEIVLTDVNSARFTCPVVQILENEAMDFTEVLKVKPSVYRM